MKAPKIPTGLVANWKSKTSKTSLVTGTENLKRANSPLGGLADIDAGGARPTNTIGNRYKTNQARQNDVCPFFITAW